MFDWLLPLLGMGPAPILTGDMIRTLSPAKLYRQVWRCMPDREHANESQYTFVYAVDLDGEVRNGGFNQYYYNSGENLRLAAESFARIGAEDVAEVVRRANACFEANSQRLVESYWDGTMKGFANSYKEKLFDDFDREYDALMKDGRLFELLDKFVRSHAGDFITQQ